MGSDQRGESRDDGWAGADGSGGPPPGHVPHPRVPGAAPSWSSPGPSLPGGETGVPRQRRAGPGAGAAEGLVPSDAELVERVRRGDDNAYEEVFRRHARSVRQYARSCCRDRDTADDLTAEVFARTLQAVRGGAGPTASVRAYLLTTVRRVAADWVRTAKQEQLVDDFAVFADTAARSRGQQDNSPELGADVHAMHQAERSLAVQAFRSLPERWQTVLWHTTVEEESPSEVAPLLGLSANAAAVLAHRAREGLKQAYLQAHVASAPEENPDCAPYAGRLGAYARGGLRIRAERGLRQHLDGCARCREVAVELRDVNAGLRATLPVAVIGWFAAGYAFKAAGVAAGAAGAAAGAGVAAAATGGPAGGSAAGAAAAGGAGGAAASEGLGLPVKIGIAAGVAVATVVTAFALTGGDSPPVRPQAKPPVASAEPAPAEPDPAPTPRPEPPAEQIRPERQQAPDRPAPAADEPSSEAPSSPAPEPTPTRTATPTPTPTPTPTTPSPTPTTPEPPTSYPLNRLTQGFLGDNTKPAVRTGASSWLWPRDSLTVAGVTYAHGVTVHGRSSVTIDLNRSCTTYDAMAGVDDMSALSGPVRFSVYGDSALLWQSGSLDEGDTAVPVHVSLEGRRSIRLVVEPDGLGGSLALADWAQSAITCR
ncbi:sigma-70 family RNA polymerase sigma factor [Streptomyces lycii]|uniref:Sigma-70 family RNA polymerase sigma factor n=1 Tax=Streptomyces lycii TaxID=2654337 RepID=A0ABQ7F9M2_9ACTN|nr:sigma-70 family RNA polymerase sigma factor [Streptomyces lycii]KAF4405566.1 sigma-70 family RNA polymerase sigma factor [Streptomyces lycii]